MTIVKITGGLGNQLFQYAFGKYLERSLEDEVSFDTQTNLQANNFTKRNLDLEKFEVNLPIASDRAIGNFLKFRTGILWRFERKFSQIIGNLNSKYTVQKSAHSQEFQVKDNSYYDGYWQCYKYVDAVRDVILNDVKAPKTFYEKHQHLLNQMRDSDSVALHVRRDDYINVKVNAALFEVCDMDYYDEAIELISKNLTDPQFFIFSQDEEWVNDNFVGDQFNYIKGNTAIDDMLLMSYCKHNIISNSTFSWWSAWLNLNPDKKIIAPKKWYKGSKNLETKNLIPENWHRI